MLTILTLNILLMIVYLSHWDWNLYKSRKDIISSLGGKKFIAMAPEGDYKIYLMEEYSQFVNWNMNRKKLIDIRGIKNLIENINKFEDGTIIHSFTIRTGIIYSIANIFVKNKITGVLSVNGLGYIFSNNLKAKILKTILKLFIKKLFNNSFDKIIFQNINDKETFIKYSNYQGETSLIPGSGIKMENFIKKEDYSNNKLKIIFASRLLRDKGINNYIELVKKMSNQNLDFYLAGEIDKGNPNSITEIDLEKIKQLNNLTYLKTIDVEKELHHYDISIIMSSYEGFSRILLESLYVGLFCISNNIPGTSWQKEFKNNVLIDNNDISTFIKEIEAFDYEEFSKINGDYNRDLIKNKYSNEIISNKYNEIYNHLEKY
tara:strand:- start:4913 stop:6037 length:1125 start_codon:yes stop_codon:yes gene_type:complete